MDDFISYSLFTLAGFFFGRLAVLMRPRRDMEPGTWKADMERLANACISYAEAEKRYVEALGRISGEKEEAVMARIHADMAKDGYTKPGLSIAEVRAMLKKHLDR